MYGQQQAYSFNTAPTMYSNSSPPPSLSINSCSVASKSNLVSLHHDLTDLNSHHHNQPATSLLNTVYNQMQSVGGPSMGVSSSSSSLSSSSSSSSSTSSENTLLNHHHHHQHQKTNPSQLNFNSSQNSLENIFMNHHRTNALGFGFSHHFGNAAAANCYLNAAAVAAAAAAAASQQNNANIYSPNNNVVPNGVNPTHLLQSFNTSSNYGGSNSSSSSTSSSVSATTPTLNTNTNGLCESQLSLTPTNSSISCPSSASSSNGMSKSNESSNNNNHSSKDDSGSKANGRNGGGNIWSSLQSVSKGESSSWSSDRKGKISLSFVSFMLYSSR
jgi:hypothetical protein